jgi:hypothetical protein
VAMPLEHDGEALRGVDVVVDDKDQTGLGRLHFGAQNNTAHAR